MLVNNAEVLHLYDHDIGSSNDRYSMLGQSFVKRLQRGDKVWVRLHKGVLRGGDRGGTVYTSFVGFLLQEIVDNEI